MDFINDFMNNLPRRPLLGHPPHFLPINVNEDDEIDAFLNNLPQWSLLGHSPHILPINFDEVDEIDAFLNNLPQRPLLGQPHLIPPDNDEEDDEIEVDVVDVPMPTHAQPLPVYGPSQVFEADLISTRLPDHWSEYSGMSYFGLEGEYEDEDQNIE